MNVLLALLTVSASLHITVWPDGPGGASRHRTLHCNPVGGTLLRPASACTKLGRIAHPFAPVPPGVACTDVFGGPQRAAVTGTFQGHPVHATFNRRNGCEIARWNRMLFLFR